MGQLTPARNTTLPAAAQTAVGVRNIGKEQSICEIAMLSGMAQATGIPLPLLKPAT